MGRFNVRKSVLVIYSTIFCLTTYAQRNFTQQFDAKVVYQLQYIPDSNNRTGVKTEYMELLINDSASLFRSINNGIVDSIMYIDFKNGKKYNPMLSALQYPTSFYYNIIKSSGFTFFSDQLGPTYFSYKEPINNFRWVLTPDTATVSGFNCQKATTRYGNRNWIAWFSTDLSFSNGPYTFGGLPGLIVEIYDEQDFWHFLLTDIINKSTVANVNYNTVFGYKEVEKNDFYKQKKYNAQNSYEIMEARGGLNGVTEENKIRVRNRLKNAAKKNNNWIELYAK